MAKQNDETPRDIAQLKAVEEWATKIPAFASPSQAEQSRTTDGLEWHRNMWLAALKALRGWPEGRIVTEADFDAALADAKNIRIG